jgi:hypothetical protein
MAHLLTSHVLAEGNSPSKETTRNFRTDASLSTIIINRLANLTGDSWFVSRALSFFSRETTCSHGKYLFQLRVLLYVRIVLSLRIDTKGLSWHYRREELFCVA